MTLRIHPLLLAALGATALWAWLGAGADADDDAGAVVALTRPGSGAAAPRATRSPQDTAAASATPGWPAARAPLSPDSGRGLMDPAAASPPPPPPRGAATAAPVLPVAPVQPPPVRAPAPPPPPPAPGTPLTLMGVVQAGTPSPQVFFTLGDQLIQARVGEVIDGRYRIEAITAKHVVVTVLPDNNRVEIPLSITTPGG